MRGNAISEDGDGAAIVSVVDESAARVATMMYLAWSFDLGVCVLMLLVVCCVCDMFDSCVGMVPLPPVVASELVCSVAGGADLVPVSIVESSLARDFEQRPTRLNSAPVKRQRTGVSP